MIIHLSSKSFDFISNSLFIFANETKKIKQFTSISNIQYRILGLKSTREFNANNDPLILTCVNAIYLLYPIVVLRNK